jgi:hypothetical protein
MGRWALGTFEGKGKGSFVVGMLHSSPETTFVRQISPARVELSDGTIADVSLINVETKADILLMADNVLSMMETQNLERAALKAAKNPK